MAVVQIETPACFDNRVKFKAWVAAARLAPPPPKDNFCRDCTPQFKKQMGLAGRCGHPKVFFMVEKGELVGVRKLYKKSGKKLILYCGATC